MKKLKNHIKDLQHIEIQRRWWILLGAVVTATVGYIIFDWQFVLDLKLGWLFVTLSLIAAVVWWCWTMRVIRHFIDFRKEETEILLDIVREVREIKDEVKNLSSNS
jgi:hypothetical protein